MTRQEWFQARLLAAAITGTVIGIVLGTLAVDRNLGLVQAAIAFACAGVVNGLVISEVFGWLEKRRGPG